MFFNFAPVATARTGTSIPNESSEYPTGLKVFRFNSVFITLKSESVFFSDKKKRNASKLYQGL